MKYCPKCGNTLTTASNFCPNCGANFTAQNIASDNSDGSVVACAIVGILFPIIGAILYYVLKNTNPKAAKIANTCSWISFLVQLILYFMIFA